MCFGKCPFQGISIIQKINLILNPNHAIEFPEYTTYGVKTSPLLIDVVKRCLNHNPKERPHIKDLLEHPFLNSQYCEKCISRMVSTIKN